MGSQTPSITGKKLCKLLEKDGWEHKRNGSHGNIYRKNCSDRVRYTQVPKKSGQLPEGTLKAILSDKQTGLGLDGLTELIDNHG